MSLFSFLRKSKQEPASDDGAYYSRAEEDSQNVRSRAKRKQATRRDEPLDPVLPEKKRARRRLVGAVALVLAVVIGLPMILDSEPRPLSEEIAIQIPSRDKAPPMSRADAPGARVAPVEPAAVERVEVARQPESPAAKGKPSHVPAPPTVPAASAPAPVKAAKADDGARALALLEGRPDPRAAEKKAEQYVIQVAALASREKVNELRAKLAGAGIKSYTQPVATAGGEATRIRIGPFASRDEAELMRARIVKLGLNATLTPA